VPVDRPGHDACRERCRVALGAAAANEAFEIGRAKAFDAVDDALRLLGAAP
jgi:hypothetical protein